VTAVTVPDGGEAAESRQPYLLLKERDELALALSATEEYEHYIARCCARVMASWLSVGGDNTIGGGMQRGCGENFQSPKEMTLCGQ